ncbi:hypothetical protein FRC98_03990 [Lujinxingia vulgaris]|uniref:DUF1440 domain-containing protein n=1 Tax=Lujinxingia vulgaris TaxID=2600176 RepID=A0A5C6XK85_9DELT|nr:hypothetical protein [Lujinxingia vulgaris]TXD38067.1 hypothetical protein FRC98_03990 [Lujinxingia vulgaris]
MSDWKQNAFKLGTALVAGSVASIAMNKMTALLEAAQPKTPRVGDAFRDRKDPQRLLIDRANKRFGWKMRRKARRLAARRLRFGLGVGSTVGGILLRRKLGATKSPLKGAAFDTALFVLVEELIKPRLGAHPGARKIPWQTHAAALGGRATYGVVNAGVRQGLQRMAPARLRPH